MSKHENLKLDQQLCFALYSATHAITRTYRNLLEQTGLTYTQYLVLLVLWEKNGLSVKTIADRLDLDSATLTPILKRLESGGLVSRVRNTADERIVEVKLTPTGLQLQDQVAGIQKRVACATGLPPDEFEHLKSSLHRLVETLTNEMQEQAEQKTAA